MNHSTATIRLRWCTAALALLAAPAQAQLTVVIPNGTGLTPGNANNAFPWGTSAATWPGVRLLCVYDAANFTNQGVTHPILITRLRWRPDDNAGQFAGGTFQQATVALSTAPVDFLQVTANFALAHGADRTLVYAGPVTHPGISGGPWGSAPAPWTIDIALTTPFLYDPSLGDLAVDCDHPGGSNFVGGTLPQMDVQGAGSLSARIYGSTLYPNANGTTQDHGVVVEVTYVGAPGAAATAIPYGTGCHDRARATFYERFAPGTFDLANTGMTLIHTGTGYVVVPWAGPWFTPVTAPLTLTDNSLSPVLPLGFTLPDPGGSTNAIRVSSNGFVWAQSTATGDGCCFGDSLALRVFGARWCPLWTDLDPTTVGAVHFDTDPANAAAYVTFSTVLEEGTGIPNTFQVAFFATGQVEYRFQACSVLGHTTLCGWSPGNGASDPGSIDLSAALPIATSSDLHALRLAAGTRPIFGTNVTLTASQVPTGSPLGAFLGGVVQHVPPLPLASIGMPDCFQHISLDATRVFLPAGNAGSMVLAVPNVPALSGTHLFFQAAAFASGLNPLGVISSNGLDLKIGTQ